MQLALIPPGPPAELLAWDDAMVAAVEGGMGEVLWFWEAQEHFVVLGYSQTPVREVNLERCEAERIPVLRRSSGGGTVVQGPGCLSYSLVLRVDSATELGSVDQTNRWMMTRQARALRQTTAARIEVHGHTDLALQHDSGHWVKFSGNAQRRTRNAVLFHGCILCEFDLAKIEEWLLPPSSEPPYRAKRRHSDFVVNLGVPTPAVRRAILAEWSADSSLPGLPWDHHRRALEQRYLRSEWHARRG